ncbi:MAG: hypothetical protein H6719_24720 [Sandaracinaceae bacterium]|nr:hypothetical protein [Sandaracinaceae bacterium]
MKILVGVLTTILVVLYPLGIWFGLTHFSARTVSLWILALLVPSLLYRFRKARREDLWAVLRIPLVIGVVVSGGALFDDRRFVLAMPVLINLALLATFATSLRGTPMIERFARMQEKDGLSDAQVAHCRQVTWVWVGFFALNASIAAVLASNEAWVSAWATYNGGIAYALMGVLFAGEYVVRQYRFRRYGDGLHDRLLRRIFPPRGDT